MHRPQASGFGKGSHVTELGAFEICLGKVGSDDIGTRPKPHYRAWFTPHSQSELDLGEGCRFGEPRSDLVCHHGQLPTQPFNACLLGVLIAAERAYTGRVLMCPCSYFVPCARVAQIGRP